MGRIARICAVIATLIVGLQLHAHPSSGALLNKDIATTGPGHVATTVKRIYDAEAGVVCYVVPNEHCMGDCAYGPAISCLPVPAGVVGMAAK